MSPLDNLLSALPTEVWFALMMAAVFAAVLAGVALLGRSDYLGKNKIRLDQLKERFGAKYRIFFKFGELRLRSLDDNGPDPVDGLEMAKILWSNNERLPRNGMPALPIFDSRGNLRLNIVLGVTHEGQVGIMAEKIIPSNYFWSKREVIASCPLQ